VDADNAIVCITDDRTLRRLLRRTLSGVVGSVAYLQRIDELPTLTGDEPQLLIVDLQAQAEVELRSTLGQLGWKPRILALGSWSEQQDALTLLDLCSCENLIARQNGMDEAELLATALKILDNGNIFGLEKYLAWGVQVREVPIVSYDDKRTAIETVREYARGAGCRRGQIGRVEIVLDELLMNALYDAPASQSGDRTVFMARAVPGGGPVSDRTVRLGFACDGRFFALSVRDEYGALESQTILDHLNRAVAYAGAPLTNTDRGAGLGLYFILNSVSRFVANIEPGRATEVICLFDLRQSGRSSRGVASSFNIFTTAPAHGLTAEPQP
jgi:hypothetical protein